jgi:hypothetical protein
MTPVLRAIQQAQRVPAGYVEPGPRSDRATIARLLAILNDRRVVAAVSTLTGKKLSTAEEIRFLKDWTTNLIRVSHPRLLDF